MGFFPCLLSFPLGHGWGWAILLFPISQALDGFLFQILQNLFELRGRLEGTKEASLDLVWIRFVVLSFPLVQKCGFRDSKAGMFNIPRALSFVAFWSSSFCSGTTQTYPASRICLIQGFSFNSPNGLLLYWRSARRYSIQDLNVCYVGWFKKCPRIFQLQSIKSLLEG